MGEATQRIEIEILVFLVVYTTSSSQLAEVEIIIWNDRIYTSLKYLGVAVKKKNTPHDDPNCEMTKAQKGSDDKIDFIGGHGFK